MKGLFYDLETNGLPDWHQPSDAPQQPHLVSLAARLVDLDTRETIDSLDMIIQPDGWEIPDDVVEVHGITTEHAMNVGIPEHLAIEEFISLWTQADIRIGHSEQFDARMIRIATKRHCDDKVIDAWHAGKVNAQCTARLATNIVCLPPSEKMKRAKRFQHKTPTLAEAYQFFTGNELENAHTAMADVDGCMAVYFAIQDH